MKILHVILGLGKGGAEHLLVDTLPEYVNNGFDVSVLQITSRWEYEEFYKILKVAGVQVYSLTNGSAKNLNLIFKLRKFLNKHEFDIVHVHLFPALYYAILATRFYSNCPKLIFTEHSSQNRRSKKWFLLPIEKYIYRRYDVVISVSEKIKERLMRTLKLHNVVVLNNGVSLSVFNQAKAYLPSFWEMNCQIPNTEFKILMVARFNYPKDHLTALKALTRLPENYTLIFAGDGNLYSKTIEITAKMKLTHRVCFLGFRMDVPQLMKSVDILILPTAYEGMSGVALEALASKTPFLGADVVGVREVVPDRSYLFEKGNDAHLVEKILQISESEVLVTKMRLKGYERAQEFTMELMVEKHIALYRSLKKINNTVNKTD